MSADKCDAPAESALVPETLSRVLQAVIPAERVITDPLRLLAYGTDASLYRLIPKVVVRAETEAEVQAVLRCCRAFGAPVTFRAAGTSLAGQALTDSVLLILGDGWDGISIERGGDLIRLQPGVIGAAANRHLAALARKIGPDPASIDAAQIGGMAANNASGMCCGTHENSYQTLESMRILFADASVLDTGDAGSRAAFAASHKAFLDGLDALARRVKADTALAERIRRKYRIKNTTGYSLNALIDFDDPIDILQHLMIGSEGTLGFISEITYRTVVDLPQKASALVVFPDIGEAARTVLLLAGAPTAAVELLDYLSIRAIEAMPGMPASIVGLPQGTAALLIETRAADPSTLSANIEAISAILAKVNTLSPPVFSDDPSVTKVYWNVRKVVFPAVAAARPVGTTVIIEDVAFKVEDLAAGVLDLQKLFADHGYHEAVIYGHARDGNMHFVIYHDFGNPAEIERYRGFLDAVCTMVVKKYDGSLKAEHGTGRNMAPYVELEWGPDAYRLMEEIKALFDPEGLLNPGVILNPDKEIHLKNFKPMPKANPLIDACMECGFCEPLCPSNKMTLSPRQRITSWREISRLQASGRDPSRLTTLAERYDYDGALTCAACGLCATVCPMAINTAKLTKELRSKNWSSLGKSIGGWTGRHFGALMTATELGLGAAGLAHKALGDERFESLAKKARAISGERLPKITRHLPTKGHFSTGASAGKGARIVYFPSCAIRSMGAPQDDPVQTPVPDVFEQLLAKAGFSAVYPKAMNSLCCGQPWDTQGLKEVADDKAAELEAALFEVSEGGKLPIVFDTSTCAYRMKDFLKGRLQILDIVEFLHDEILPKLTLTNRQPGIVLHLNCGARKMGMEEKLTALAKACAEEVTLPEHMPCCGFAGMWGFTTPELNEHATRRLAEQVPHGCHDGYSSNRTCEIGLADQAGIPFRSIIHLVARAAGL